MENNWIAAVFRPWPAYPGPVKGASSINHRRFKKWLTKRRRGRRGKEKKLPRMQDASPMSDPGFFYFVVHCDTFRCNSISIFLLHFKVAENNTLNGKMKYVPSPACYLSPPLPPLCLPTYTPHLIQIENLSEGKRGKCPAWAFFLCFPCDKSLAVLSSSG